MLSLPKYLQITHFQCNCVWYLYITVAEHLRKPTWKWRMLPFGLQIQRFQSMVGWLCCFGAYGEAKHHGRENKKNCSSPCNRKQWRERKEWELPYLLQEFSYKGLICPLGLISCMFTNSHSCCGWNQTFGIGPLKTLTSKP